MYVKTELPVLAGLPVYFLPLLTPGLPVLQVLQSITYPEILLVLHIADEALLQLSEQLVVVKNLRVTGLPRILFLSKQYFEGASLVLALGLCSFPVRHNFLSLSHWSLHEQGGIVRGRYIDEAGLV